MARARLALAACWSSWFWVWTIRMTFTVLVPALALDFHLSPVDAGLLVGAFQATVAVGMVGWGPLADIVPPKIVASSLLASSGLLLAASPLSPSYPILLMLSLAAGAALGGWQPNCVPLIGSLYERRRGSALAVYDTAAPVGFTAGALMVAGFYGLLGWQGLIMVVSLLALLPSIMVYVIAPGGRIPRGTRGRGGRASLLFSALLVLAFIAVSGSVIGLPAYLPVYLTTFAGMSIAGAASLVGLPRLSGVVGQLLSGWASDELGRRRVMVILLAIILAGDVGVAFFGGSGQAIAISLLVTFIAGAAFYPVALALVYESYPGYRGAATGIFLFLGNIVGSGLMPPILAAADITFPPGSSLWLIAVMALVGLIASLTMKKTGL